MPRGPRTERQRWASLLVKLDLEVASEADRLAGAARMSRDAYINLALRHYNRFHALTKRNRVRVARSRRVVVLFPATPSAGSHPVPAPSKPGKRRDNRR